MDAEGRYSFDVVPGTYRVQFLNDQGLNISQYPPREGEITAPNYNDAGSDGRTTAFTVAPGQTYPNIDAGFAALGTISGTVFNDVDQDSQRGTDPGVGGVTVALFKPNGDPVRDANGNPVTTVTDEFGDYTFTNIPGGDYQVRFTKPDGYEFIPNFDGIRDVTLTIDATTNSKTDVDAGLRKIPTPVVTETVTATTDPADPTLTPTATTTLPVTATPTDVPENGTITVTQTVIVPPSVPAQPEPVETVTVTVTETAAPTTPRQTETITLTPTEQPSAEPGETPTVTVTVVVPHGEEDPGAPITTVTETVTQTAEPTTPRQTETVTLTPTELPTAEPGGTPTVTVTVVVPPEVDGPGTRPTRTVTVTADPENPRVTPTATRTLEPTEPADPTAPVTVTVVVPPTPQPPTQVTETVTVTEDPDFPGETPTETRTLEPTDPNAPTVTVTVVVPPGEEGSEEPTPAVTVTETVTMTEDPDQPGVTPTATVILEPTELPEFPGEDGTYTVTVTAVVPPSETETTEEPSTEETTTTEVDPVQTPTEAVTGTEQPTTAPETTDQLTTVVDTEPAPVVPVGPTGQAPAGDGSSVVGGSAPDRQDPPASSSRGISGLAQTGANVIGVLVIAALLIGLGVFLIRRKHD